MLQILDEKVLKSDDEIESQYKNCKYLCIIDSYASLEESHIYNMAKGLHRSWRNFPKSLTDGWPSSLTEALCSIYLQLSGL